MNYKSYDKQVSECVENGNRFSFDAPYLDFKISVCIKYKTCCHSKACLKERMWIETS